MPQKIQIFIWKSMRNWLHQYMAFSHLEINNQYPRCNTPKTTIHILRDWPWAKMVWCHSPGVLPLSFFSPTISNLALYHTLILCHQLPWKIYFPFLYWHLWLVRNERIFNNQSCSQYRLVRHRDPRPIQALGPVPIVRRRDPKPIQALGLVPYRPWAQA